MPIFWTKDDNALTAKQRFQRFGGISEYERQKVRTQGKGLIICFAGLLVLALIVKFL